MSNDDGDNVLNPFKGVKREVNSNEESLNLTGAEEIQLNKYKNIALYLDKHLGKKWVIAFMKSDDADGQSYPAYIPNPNIDTMEAVYLSEIIKRIEFNFLGLEEG